MRISLIIFVNLFVLLYKCWRKLPNFVLNITNGSIPRAMAPAGGMKAAQKPTYFSKNVVARAARPPILTILFDPHQLECKIIQDKQNVSIPIVSIVDVRDGKLPISDNPLAILFNLDPRNGFGILIGCRFL